MNDERLTFKDDVLELVQVQNASIAVWHGAPGLDHVEEVRKASLSNGDRFPKGAGFINVIYGGMPKFSSEVRSELSKVIKQTEDFSVGSAHIILAPGLVGAATRAFLSTIFLMGKTKQPAKVFGDFDSAVDWFVPRLNAPGEVEWTHDELRKVCESVGRSSSAA